MGLVFALGCIDPFDSPLPTGQVEAPPAACAAPGEAGLEYGAPRPALALSSTLDDRFPAPSADGLTVLFARTERSGSLFVHRPYVAHRASLDEPFEPPARAAAFGDRSIWDFELSADGLEWLYWTDLGQLARSRRTSLDDPWSPPELLGFDGRSPSLSSDGLELYYVALGGAGVVSRRRASLEAAWGQPRAVLLASSASPDAVDLSSDGRRLLVTIGGDVAIAERDLTGDFLEPQPVASLQGGFESARFGAGDRLIAATDARRTDRDIAIAEAR